jgi:hypothetical protein
MQHFEPPIQNLANIDIIGERHDGGVDLAIIAAGPLDASAETLAALDQKIRNYLREINSDGFRAKYSTAFPGKVRIIVYCQHAIDMAALGLIEALRTQAQSQGVTLELNRSVV